MAYKERKPSKRIWLYNGTAYKSEAQFMRAARSGGVVTIYDMVESHSNAIEYAKQIITQRERDEQLQVLLEGNSTVTLISNFKSMLMEYKPKCQRYIDGSYNPLWSRDAHDIYQRLERGGMNMENFKLICSNHREFLLHKVSYDQKWYECLLRLHNFTKIEEALMGDYDYINKKRNMIKTPQEAIDAFAKAKEVVKKEKKENKVETL